MAQLMHRVRTKGIMINAALSSRIVKHIGAMKMATGPRGARLLTSPDACFTAHIRTNAPVAMSSFTWMIKQPKEMPKKTSTSKLTSPDTGQFASRQSRLNPRSVWWCEASRLSAGFVCLALVSHLGLFGSVGLVSYFRSLTHAILEVEALKFLPLH